MPNTASLNYALACQTEVLLSFDLLKPCFVHENTGHEFKEMFRMFSVVSFFVPGLGWFFFFCPCVSGPLHSTGAGSTYLLLPPLHTPPSKSSWFFSHPVPFLVFAKVSVCSSWKE